MDLSLITKAREIAIGDFRPDLTLLLDISPKAGMERVRERGQLDRFERSKMDFFTRVRESYLDYAHKHSDVVKIIDASLDMDTVEKNAIKEISCLF